MNNKIIDINVDDLIKEVQENVKNREYKYDILSFNNVEMEDMNNVIQKASRFDIEEFEQNVIDANERCNVQSYRYIHSNRMFLGKMLMCIKKIIRKSCKFYVEPIVDDQNGFNVSIARTCNQLLVYVKETQKINEDLNNRVKELENQINEKKV